jgi:hypothetical protein
VTVEMKDSGVPRAAVLEQERRLDESAAPGHVLALLILVMHRSPQGLDKAERRISLQKARPCLAEAIGDLVRRELQGAADIAVLEADPLDRAGEVQPRHIQRPSDSAAGQVDRIAHVGAKDEVVRHRQVQSVDRAADDGILEIDAALDLGRLEL